VANTSIVTESARAAAAVNVQDYAASVRSHINAGWEAHHQVGVNNRAFPIGQTLAGVTIGSALADDQVNRNPHGVAFACMLRLRVTRYNTSTGLDESLDVLVPVVGVEDVAPATVPTAPVIDYADTQNTNLASIALATNASTTLKVSLSNASAEFPVVYQWRKNGVNIAGANTASLVVTMSALATTNDSYQCVVAGFGGITYSSVAVITHA